MNKIKWGIIGSCGIAEKRTIPGLLMAENAQCVAVMDINEEGVRAVAEKFGISRTYTDIDELLAQKDIDAVYIATPVFCHKEQVIKAADAGKHILLEKPMGLTSKEAQEIADYCKEKGVKLGVGFMMRFHDAHEKIKKIIEKGEIGEIVSAYAKFNSWSPASPVKWRQTKAYSGGGTMMDMGIHCIDLLQYLTGLKAVQITGLYGNQIHKYPDTEDGCSAVLKMDNGSLFTVEANFNIPDVIGGCRFEIYGTTGVVSAEGTIGQTEKGIVNVTVMSAEGSVSKRNLEYVSGNMYTKETERFSQAILDDSKVPVTAEEGIFNQKVIEAVYESQETNRIIEV